MSNDSTKSNHPIDKVSFDLFFSEAATAYHEAGHVVIASLVNQPCDSCSIQWCDSLERWCGKSPAPPLSGLDVVFKAEGTAKTALAGFLTQTLYCARSMDSRTTGFSILKEADYPRLDAYLRDNKRSEESPGSVQLVFTLPPSDVAFTFDGRGFSTADSKIFNQCVNRLDGVSTVTLAQAVMDELSHPDRWAQVRLVAETLLEEPTVGDEKLKTLGRERILRLLRSKK